MKNNCKAVLLYTFCTPFVHLCLLAFRTPFLQKILSYQLPAAARIRLVRTVSHSFPSRLHFNLLNFEPPTVVISFSTSRYIDGSELICNTKNKIIFGRGKKLLQKAATTIRSKTMSLKTDLSMAFSV